MLALTSRFEVEIDGGLTARAAYVSKAGSMVIRWA